MSVPHAAARAALSWVFLHAGVEVVRHPEARARSAGWLLERVRAAAPVALPDDVTLVRANAATQVVAGTALAAGVAPRLAAAALLGSLVPTTVGGHPYWRFDDPAQRAAQRIHFHKNLGLAGGLLLAVLTPTHRRHRRGTRP